MIYATIISAIWAITIYLLFHRRETTQLSEYTKALEELSKLLPNSIKEIGGAIQSNLYPYLGLRHSESDGGTDIATQAQDVFEATSPVKLDWEEMI